MAGDEPLSGIGGDHIVFRDNTFSGTVIGVQHIHLPPPPRVPGQIVEGDIPQRPPGFQPREELLHQLNDRLGGETSAGGAVVICAVGGTPGVGKTMLAASYAWACQAAGDLARAISLFEQTLTDRERVLGPDHPTTCLVRGNLENVRNASARTSSGGWRRWLPGRLRGS